MANTKNLKLSRGVIVSKLGASQDGEKLYLQTDFKGQIRWTSHIHGATDFDFEATAYAFLVEKELEGLFQVEAIVIIR